MNINNQLVIILIAVGLSFLSWAIGELRKKAELRRVERERERRREEALRTGRNLTDLDAAGAARAQAQQSPGQPRQQPDLKTLAERRQAQLRELREQQASRMRGQRTPRPTIIGAPSTSPPTVAPPPFGRPFQGPTAAPRGQRPIAPGAGRPAAPPIQTGNRPTPRTAPRPIVRTDPRALQQAARQQEAARLKAEARRREAEARTRNEAAEAEQIAARPPRTVAPDASLAGLRVPSAVVAGQALTLEDWRRAIVVSELLAPPISLRPEGSGADVEK